MISFFDNLKDKSKIEILLKVIARVYTKNPAMQKLKEESMIDVCEEEGASHEQVYFLHLFADGFIVMDYLNIIFCVRRTAYENNRVYFYR